MKLWASSFKSWNVLERSHHMAAAKANRNNKNSIRCLTMATQEVKILLSSKDALIDEAIRIRIVGLEPGEKATVRLSTFFGRKPYYHHSFAHFKANHQGIIEIGYQSSLSGTYTGVSATGLFWSIELISGQTRCSRILVRDARQYLPMALEVYKGFVDFHVPLQSVDEIKRANTLIAEASITRRYLSPNVDRQDVNVGRLRGTLFVPQNTKHPMPGIIDLFGAIGGRVEFRAALLASHGFVTFALSYLAYDDLPKRLADVEAEYFDEAVEWLSIHPKVQSGGIGIIGVSVGGVIAQLTASRRPEIKAVVGISTLDRFPAFSIKVDGKPKGSFMLDQRKIIEDKNGFLITRNAFLIPADDGNDDTIIPVERIQGRVLLLCGLEDKAMNCLDMANRIKNRMDKYEKGHLCTIVSYPGTGHLIEPPYAPLCRQVAMYKNYLDYGGEKANHAVAQEDAWRKIQTFFRETLNGTRSNL